MCPQSANRMSRYCSLIRISVVVVSGSPKTLFKMEVRQHRAVRLLFFFVLQLQCQFRPSYYIATGPVGLEPNGRASCRDLSPTSSECFIQCDDKCVLVNVNVLISFWVHLVRSYHRYKLDGNKCIFDDGNGVKDCGCDAPLSFAYPDKACACVTSLDKGNPGTQCSQWITHEHSNF